MVLILVITTTGLLNVSVISVEMEIFIVIESHHWDIYGEQNILGYFSTQDKAETFILKNDLLDRVTDSCEVYVQNIILDKEE